MSRLLVLHEAARIELPEPILTPYKICLGDLPKRTISDEMLHRPALASLMEGANFINKAVGSSILELKFPVPHINYASLVFNVRGLKDQNNIKDFILQQVINLKILDVNEVVIELIDSHSTLFRTLDIIGILKMKIRLMTQCGLVVHKIYEDDIKRLHSDELTMAAFILDTLSNTCNGRC